MAQGQVKGLQKAKASGARHAAKAAAQPKKGRRYAAPKKKDAMKHAVMHQVRSHCLSACINRRDSCNCVATQREDQQKYRATSRLSCLVRQADYHEERRDGGVSIVCAHITVDI